MNARDDDGLVEVVRNILFKTRFIHHAPDDDVREMQTALAALDTAITEARREAIEECAKVETAARNYAENYLVDERNDPDLCINEKHHRAVMALFDALASIPAPTGGEK